jgi:hypothetical protein
MQGQDADRSSGAIHGLRAIGGNDLPEDRRHPVIVSSLGTRSIFRQLIFDEIRSGRLTAARRRRIIAYAARLGLSAVQAGELIAACREQVLANGDSVERAHALQVILPLRRRVPTGVRMAAVAITAIVLEWLFLRWRW